MSHCAVPRIAASSAVSAPIDADELRASRRRVPERRAARDQIDAGGHHRRGVDQGRDRGRAFHRVGQPGLQRNLRRFRGAGDEERDASRTGSTPRGSVAALAKTSAYPIDPVAANSTKTAYIRPTSPTTLMTNALQRGRDGRWLVEPEADQEIRSEADEAPADEQPDEVVGEHQRQHREHEEVHVREEARDRFVARHVTDRVDVDEPADAGDDQRPDERERVQQQPEGEARRPAKRAA